MNDKHTLAENMAVAVLKGDMAAARALCDLLMEEYSTGAVEIPPVTKITANAGRLRAVFKVRNSSSAVNVTELGQAFARWVAKGDPLLLQGMDMELYQLPEES